MGYFLVVCFSWNELRWECSLLHCNCFCFLVLLFSPGIMRNKSDKLCGSFYQLSQVWQSYLYTTSIRNTSTGCGVGLGVSYQWLPHFSLVPLWPSSICSGYEWKWNPDVALSEWPELTVVSIRIAPPLLRSPGHSSFLWYTPTDWAKSLWLSSFSSGWTAAVLRDLDKHEH